MLLGSMEPIFELQSGRPNLATANQSQEKSSHRNEFIHVYGVNSDDLKTPIIYPALSPQAALLKLSQYLTCGEKTEILKYPSVYFVGSLVDCDTKSSALLGELSQKNNSADQSSVNDLRYPIVLRDHIAFRLVF